MLDVLPRHVGPGGVGEPITLSCSWVMGLAALLWVQDPRAVVLQGR